MFLSYANKLPFRHFIQYLDEKSTGLKGFSGPIREQLGKCEDREF